MPIKPALKDDDYLLEIKVRVAVRKADAAAVIALGPHWKRDKTEEDRVASAIEHLLDKGLAKHAKLIDAVQYKASRFRSVGQFNDYVNEAFREFHRGKPQLVPPTKKDEDPIN